MTYSPDPRVTDRLGANYGFALAVARKRFPTLSDEDHRVVVHDAYVLVLQRLTAGPLADPLAYLLRVVQNTGNRMLTRDPRFRYATRPADPELIDAWADRTQRPPTPEEQVLARADNELVRSVLRTDLGRRERLILFRRAFEDRPPAEVAAEVGTTARGYRHLLADAHRQLAAGVERARIRQAGTRLT